MHERGGRKASTVLCPVACLCELLRPGGCVCVEVHLRVWVVHAMASAADLFLAPLAAIQTKITRVTANKCMRVPLTLSWRVAVLAPVELRPGVLQCGNVPLATVRPTSGMSCFSLFSSSSDIFDA